MPKSRPLLEIEEYFVERLSVDFNELYDPEQPSTLQTKINISTARHAHDENLQRVGIEFRGRGGEKINAPYQISLRIVGFFRFGQDTAAEVRAKMVGTNALPILYGIARGVVAQATAQFPAGKYILPTVNFIEILKREAQRAAIAATQHP